MSKIHKQALHETVNTNSQSMQRDALGLKFYELNTCVFLHPSQTPTEIRVEGSFLRHKSVGEKRAWNKTTADQRDHQL